MTQFSIGKRAVGSDQRPLVVAEVGINHEGDIKKRWPALTPLPLRAPRSSSFSVTSPKRR